MPIDTLNIFVQIYLCRMYIYTDRKLCYNTGILEEAHNYRSLPDLEGMMMAVSKAQQAAVNRYMKNNYDRVNLTMPKGEKAIVKAHADAAGESVNAFILRAVHNAMQSGNAAQGTPERSQGPVLLAQAVDVELVKAHAEKMEETLEAFLSRAVDGQIVRDETALRLKNLK